MCSLSLILRRREEEACSAVKENMWWVTHQYKSLVQRLSLNINTNWSVLPVVDERNDIIGAQMDKLKKKSSWYFHTLLFYWCVMYSEIWCICLGLTCCSYIQYVCISNNAMKWFLLTFTLLLYTSSRKLQFLKNMYFKIFLWQMSDHALNQWFYMQVERSVH